jgi:hypothetical protein
MSDIAEYLRVMASVQKQCNQGYSSCDFILKHGRKFSTGPRSFPRWGKLKECFKNALEAATLHGFVYCEGYASGVIPVLHAWCVDPKTGLVVDPTWENGTEYFGVPFQHSYVLDFVDRHQVYDSLIENYRDKWPLIVGTADLSQVLNLELNSIYA